MIRKISLFVMLFSVVSSQAMDDERSLNISIGLRGALVGFLDANAMSFGIQVVGKIGSGIGGLRCLANTPGIYDIKAKSGLAFGSIGLIDLSFVLPFRDITM